MRDPSARTSNLQLSFTREEADLQSFEEDVSCDGEAGMVDQGPGPDGSPVITSELDDIYDELDRKSRIIDL